jgi:hypothetical protein
MRISSTATATKKEAPPGASLHLICFVYFAAFARRLLCLAAAFLWIRPFREARSRSLTAASFSSAFPPEEARFSAVRSADLWARFRIAAARDFRMFFFAEAILGTN